MKAQQMPMGDMGYALIDRAGVIRARKIDSRFGERGDEIVKALTDVPVASGR
jgi:hypothetical protein